MVCTGMYHFVKCFESLLKWSAFMSHFSSYLKFWSHFRYMFNISHRQYWSIYYHSIGKVGFSGIFSLQSVIPKSQRYSQLIRNNKVSIISIEFFLQISKCIENLFHHFKLNLTCIYMLIQLKLIVLCSSWFCLHYTVW